MWTMAIVLPPPPPDPSDMRIRSDSLAGLRTLEGKLEPRSLQRLTRLEEAIAFDWQMLLRIATAAVIVVAAYRVSLASLMELMRLDTPLAHLALVPFISIGLAVAVRSRNAGPDIHDRQLDWILGLFLVAVAFVASVILPARLSSQFWIWRIDLLTMPLFIAGVITLLFGTRTLWKYRAAVLFLFLAWPYPYSLVLDKWLGEFTQTTIWALDRALSRIDLASRVQGSESVFEVTKNGFNVQMSVASACSGANGLVGFVLVAGAFLVVVRGSKTRKALWLVSGAMLVWVLNVVRILVIFWSAGQWGERVAIDGFHPYVGLVVFNLAVLIMVVLLRPFGLRMGAERSVVGIDELQSPPPPKIPKRTHRPRPVAAFACVGVLALGVGAYNGQLRDYDRIADSLGSPRLANFASSLEHPTGWTVNQTDTYDWSKRFFGSESTWNRYMYLYGGDTTSGLQANIPITVDVIETPDRAALSAYGIEQCYTFHGHSISGRQSVDLGNGLVGGMLTWSSDDDKTTWTTLYWHWPIKSETGTEYERVTLVMNDQPTNVFTSPELATDSIRQIQLDVNDVLRGTGSPEDQARLVETRKFMIGFARDLVAQRSAAPDA